MIIQAVFDILLHTFQIKYIISIAHQRRICQAPPRRRKKPAGVTPRAVKTIDVQYLWIIQKKIPSSITNSAGKIRNSKSPIPAMIVMTDNTPKTVGPFRTVPSAACTARFLLFFIRKTISKSKEYIEREKQ